jgi:hypothetical protein
VIILSVLVKERCLFFVEVPSKGAEKNGKEKEGEENYPRAWKEWVARYLNRSNSGAI